MLVSDVLECEGCKEETGEEEKEVSLQAVEKSQEELEFFFFTFIVNNVYNFLSFTCLRS